MNEYKNDVDRYLTDPMEDPTRTNFDVLEWWKNNATNYKVLSLVARDILAIPVSTVASESAFSTGGHILDPFRSSLSPKMVEALICTQNWLRSREHINLIDVEEFNEYEDIESGNLFTFYSFSFYFISSPYCLFCSKLDSDDFFCYVFFSRFVNFCCNT